MESQKRLRTLLLAYSLFVLGCAGVDDSPLTRPRTNDGGPPLATPVLPTQDAATNARDGGGGRTNGIGGFGGSGIMPDAGVLPNPLPPPVANPPVAQPMPPAAPAPGPVLPSPQPSPEPSKPWSPTDLKNLVLWLDAGASDTVRSSGDGTVLRWLDRSSTRSDAVADSSDRPHQDDGNAIHFGPGVTKLVIKDRASLQWGRGDFFVAAIVKYESTASNLLAVLAKQLGHDPYTGVVLFSHAADQGGEPGTIKGFLAQDQQLFSRHGGYNDGRYHVVGLRRHDGRVQIRIDGKLDDEVAASEVDVSAVGFDFYLGGPFPFEGWISHVVATAGRSSDDDIAKLEGYLLARRPNQ